MSGKQESIGDVLREWRGMVCYHEGPVHPLNHGAVMRNLDRIEAALKRDNLLRVPVDVWNSMAHTVESADAFRKALREIRDRLVYLYGKLDGTFSPPALKEICEIADDALAKEVRNV